MSFEEEERFGQQLLSEVSENERTESLDWLDEYHDQLLTEGMFL